MKNPHLSLVIPAYNEKKRLKKGLTTAINFLQQQKYSWEVIVVDDGSTDNTSQIVSQFQQSWGKNLHLLTSPSNFGKGHAIRIGVKAVAGDYIIFSDIDFSVPIGFAKEFLKALQKYDLVIGSRRLKISKVTQRQNKLREYLGHGFTQLSNFVLGLNHSDHTCGFKGFRSQAAKKLFRTQKIDGWAFDSEILFLAKKFGYSVKEIPVTWHNDPHSKVNLISDTIKSFLSLLQIHLNNLFGKYK